MENGEREEESGLNDGHHEMRDENLPRTRQNSKSKKQDEEQVDGNGPLSAEKGRFAVLLDGSTSTFSVHSIVGIGGVNVKAGEMITVDGISQTIIDICPTREMAIEKCDDSCNEFNAFSIGQVFHNGSKKGGAEREGDGAEERDHRREEKDQDFTDRYELEDERSELAIGTDPYAAIRYIFGVYYNELSEDMARLNKRHESLTTMMEIVMGGTWNTRGIDDSMRFDPREPLVSRRIGEKKLFRFARRDERDEEERKRQKKGEDAEIPRFSQMNFGTTESSGKRSCTLPENRERYKKQRYDSEGEPLDENGGEGSTRDYKRPAKGAHPGYPFPSLIGRGEEERCLAQSNGQPASFAQRISQLLFHDSLHLYFKDQDPQKRQWLHDLVDYRYPSEDKMAQMYKWKSCSWAINKIRIKDGAVDGGSRRSLPTVIPTYSDLLPRKAQNYKSWTGKEEISHVKPDFPYVGEVLEQSIFEKSPEDPIKYVERLAFHLFHDSLDKLFSEQDGARKEWLRDMVDYRFPIEEKLKRDSRWKVCGAAANRNRLKHVVNGVVLAYPYVTKEFEEECLRAARGNPTVYAEMMGRGLFHESINVSFKDQDPRKRTWLHDILDRRFPTSDKIKQIQKWKLCSSAINKNRTLSASQLAPFKKHQVKKDDEKGERAEKTTGKKREEKERRGATAGAAADEERATTSSQERETDRKRQTERAQGQAREQREQREQRGERDQTQNTTTTTTGSSSATTTVGGGVTRAAAAAQQDGAGGGAGGRSHPTRKTQDPSTTTTSSTSCAHPPSNGPSSSTRTSSSTVNSASSSSTNHRPQPKRTSSTAATSTAAGSATSSSSSTAVDAHHHHQGGPPAKMAKKRNSITSVDPSITFPYGVTDEQEEEFFAKAQGNAPFYAKSVAQLLFKDNLDSYFKDQEDAKRAYIRKLVDVRFPSARKRDYEMKWKNCTIAINRNRTSWKPS